MKDFFTDWTATKIVAVVTSLLFIGAFAFTTIWTITNWNKVAGAMSGSNLYTRQDVDNAFEDGFNLALEHKQTYEDLIESYKDTILLLNTQVADLTLGNSEKQSQILSLQNHPC